MAPDSDKVSDFALPTVRLLKKLSDLTGKNQAFIFDCVTLLFEKVFFLSEDPFELFESAALEAAQSNAAPPSPADTKGSSDALLPSQRSSLVNAEIDQDLFPKNSDEMAVKPVMKQATQAQIKAYQERVSCKTYQILFLKWLRMTLEKRYGWGWHCVFGRHTGFSCKAAKHSAGVFGVGKDMMVLVYRSVPKQWARHFNQGLALAEMRKDSENQGGEIQDLLSDQITKKIENLDLKVHQLRSFCFELEEEEEKLELEEIALEEHKEKVESNAEEEEDEKSNENKKTLTKRVRKSKNETPKALAAATVTSKTSVESLSTTTSQSSLSDQSKDLQERRRDLEERIQKFSSQERLQPLVDSLKKSIVESEDKEDVQSLAQGIRKKLTKELVKQDLGEPEFQETTVASINSCWHVYCGEDFVASCCPTVTNYVLSTIPRKKLLEKTGPASKSKTKSTVTILAFQHVIDTERGGEKVKLFNNGFFSRFFKFFSSENWKKNLLSVLPHMVVIFCTLIFFLRKGLCEEAETEEVNAQPAVSGVPTKGLEKAAGKSYVPGVVREAICDPESWLNFGKQAAFTLLILLVAKQVAMKMSNRKRKF